MDPEFWSGLTRVLPFIIVPVVIAIAIWKKRIMSVDTALQAPESIPKSFYWWGFFLFLVIVVEISLSRMGILEISPWHYNIPVSIIRIVGIVILAPIAEELLFRGLILHKLVKRKLNIHLAVFIQAVLFVLLHSFAYENSVSSNIGIAQSFVDACLFAYARLSTKSIFTSIAMHLTGNLIAILERILFF